jgi:hypothetical protein
VRGPGGDARGTLLPPGDDTLYRDLVSTLAAHPDETPSTSSGQGAALDDIGRLLFAALFQGPIRDTYVRSQGALGTGQGMRLTFNIDERAAAIGALPWELLYDPDQGPLALLDMPVVRYLPQQAVIPTL